MLFYRHRWYDGMLGRFLSEDAYYIRPGETNPTSVPEIGIAGVRATAPHNLIGRAQDAQLYGFVRGNPLRFADPLGLETMGECIRKAEERYREALARCRSLYWWQFGLGVGEAIVGGAVGGWLTGNPLGAVGVGALVLARLPTVYMNSGVENDRR
jgi:hypothetical protein